MKSPRLRLALALTLLPLAAHAYVDPGSGMLIWQGLIALVGAVIVFVRHPWETIKAIGRRLFRK